LPKALHSIILEEASLELVPEKSRQHDSCKLVENRFGIPPQLQILDDNYHQQIIAKMSNREKRGRPDIVHFALLDITSTPVYMESLVEVYVHTINNTTIKILSGVRLPRTFQRFCGVMAKVLSGKMEEKEKELFEINNVQAIDQLVSSIDSDRAVCLSTEGVPKDLPSFVREIHSTQETATWIVGGFPRGHFGDDVKSLATDVISVSKYSLPAHVVTARLCNAIESVANGIFRDVHNGSTDTSTA
jgi:rRNA small subunit pseudouridine methyltransferase Nep1